MLKRIPKQVAKDQRGHVGVHPCGKRFEVAIIEVNAVRAAFGGQQAHDANQVAAAARGDSYLGAGQLQQALDNVRQTRQRPARLREPVSLVPDAAAAAWSTVQPGGGVILVPEPAAPQPGWRFLARLPPRGDVYTIYQRPGVPDAS